MIGVLDEASELIGENFSSPIKNYDSLTKVGITYEEARGHIFHIFKRRKARKDIGSVRDVTFIQENGENKIWVAFNRVSRDGLDDVERLNRIIDQVLDILVKKRIVVLGDN